MTVLLWNGNTHAQKLPIPQDLPYNMQLHGFFSQSWLKTTDNNVFGPSSSGSGSFDSREIGVNGSMRPLTNLQISVQGLSRWAGEGSEGNFRLDYGFLDYTLLSRESSQLGVRLGRMKTPLGFYNDTRDVPFTRPSILLPQSIYFDRTRKLALAADGGHLYGEYRTDYGDFSFQGGVVQPLVAGDETEAAVFSKLRPGHLTPQTSYVGRVNYDLDGGRVRLAVSTAQVNMGFTPPAGNNISNAIQFTPVIFSAQYNAERWSLTSEYALRPLKYDLPNLGMSFTGESYYFQGAYRFTPQWEGIIRYDVLYTNRNDRDGKEWHALTGAPAHTRFAKDLTAGLRWNITPELMLRAEYHWVRGTGWLSTLDNPTPSGLTEQWHLFSILGSYRF